MSRNPALPFPIPDEAYALDGLNPEQAEAAAWGEGPMLVLAGPGTGKTGTLVRRFLVLRARQVEASRILCLTFARAAATEMRERISAVSGIRAEQVPAGTMHGIALALLREHPRAFPDLSSRRLAGEEEARAAFQAAARNLGWGDIEGAAGAVDRLKDRRIRPGDRDGVAAATPPGMDPSRLSSLFAAYQQCLSAAGIFDFGDLIDRVAHGLEQDRALAAGLARRRPWIMVDEFQDLNPAQHALLEPLLGEQRNLWAVADDDQLLYGWRSADVSAVLGFADRNPGSSIIRLTQNYRSRPAIVEAANRLIAHNVVRFPKVLRPTRPEAPGCLECFAWRDPEAEAEGIADRIASAIAAGQSPDTIAVLARVGHRLGPVERALGRRGVATEVAGAPCFTERPEIKLALRALRDASGNPRLSDGPPAPPWISSQMRESRGDFAARASSLCLWLARRPPGSADSERREAWAYALADLSQEIRAAGTAEALADRLKRGPATGPRVRLSTVHAAKGLEWNTVILIGWESGVIPHPLSADVEEERRNAYVGMTRARDLLIVSWADSRAGRNAGASVFVFEAGLRPGAAIRPAAPGTIRIAGGNPGVRRRRRT